ncbi:MAG: cation diffusion facilitator family transporter, partial [Propionibacteriaceae bacterium]|nr:cation diffusion facilitator family transporter [Propionibacteriaceae bacterium]
MAVETGSGGTSLKLDNYLWLSLGASLATLAIKTLAAWLTNSIGLWSDALESIVNVVAALIAIWAMRLSTKPADHNHDFGHGKAEYVSSGVEGSMVFVAAGAIIISAVMRLVSPAPLESLSFGLLLSLSASLINLFVGLLLFRVGRKNRSITLEADGQHLLTDVMTSVGVMLGIGLVALTGWTILDPVVALAVGVTILFTGYRLVRRSVVGLLDGTLPPEEVDTITEVLNGIAGDPRVHISQLLTRESGRQRFVYAPVSVPGHWTVRRSHDGADAVEEAVDPAFAGTTTFG